LRRSDNNSSNSGSTVTTTNNDMCIFSLSLTNKGRPEERERIPKGMEWNYIWREELRIKKKNEKRATHRQTRTGL
jgi:hypothetical protein